MDAVPPALLRWTQQFVIFFLDRCLRNERCRVLNTTREKFVFAFRLVRVVEVVLAKRLQLKVTLLIILDSERKRATILFVIVDDRAYFVCGCAVAGIPPPKVHLISQMIKTFLTLDFITASIKYGHRALRLLHTAGLRSSGRTIIARHHMIIRRRPNERRRPPEPYVLLLFQQCRRSIEFNFAQIILQAFRYLYVAVLLRTIRMAPRSRRLPIINLSKTFLTILPRRRLGQGRARDRVHRAAGPVGAATCGVQLVLEG